MKLLLIGFSEQNAQALALLVQMDFSKTQVEVVPRQFSDDLKLTLPPLQMTQKCQGLIIDLDGVGMLRHDSQNEALLSKFIHNMPTLLLSRRSLDLWQQSTSLNHDHILYVQKPYNKNTIQASLHQLNELISQTCNGSPKPQSAHIGKQPISESPKDESKIKNHAQTHNPHLNNHQPKQTVQEQPHDLNKPATNTDSHVYANPKIETRDLAKTWNILKTYFPVVYENKLIEHLLTIVNAKTAVQVKVGNYQLLANPKQGCVIVDSDMSRIVDYCSILKTHHRLDDKIQIQTLGQESYLKHLQFLQKLGYQQQSITTLFWQIFDEALDKNMPMRHLLRLKVTFVPNFSAMHFVPSYMHSVISSCLTIPRSIEDIERLFPELDIHQINRIFVLCILSGICDYDILTKNASQLPAQEILVSKQNKKEPLKKSGIDKANQTGFFKRLLKKLSF